MTKLEKPTHPTTISTAMRFKQKRKTEIAAHIDALESELLADIESFDLEAVELPARREEFGRSRGAMNDAALVFPEIVPASPPHSANVEQAKVQAMQPEQKFERSSLLCELRQQAKFRQQELHAASTDRTLANESLDQALKHLFFFLHDLVQQLNILKPPIPRDFALLEQYAISQLSWQEGFADYRTQSHSAGALVELVTFTCRLSGKGVPVIEKVGPAVESFQRLLFDYGLPFNCKEFKNQRRYIERAEFEVRGEISVSARWRADFDQGRLILETRNLERLGGAIFSIHPASIDYPLLDDFGRLILGQANRFRELANRH